jgi:hypothetical protein
MFTLSLWVPVTQWKIFKFIAVEKCLCFKSLTSSTCKFPAGLSFFSLCKRTGLVIPLKSKKKTYFLSIKLKKCTLPTIDTVQGSYRLHLKTNHVALSIH